MRERTTMDPPRLEEVSDRIFAYIQPDGSWFLNNAGFIVGSKGVTLVDQCGTEARARALLEAVGRTTSAPIQTLVNTHHHADHTFGNFTVPAATTIVGHRRARDEVIATGVGIAQLFEGPDWGDIEVAPPFLCFEEQLTLFVDDLEVQLIHFGTPAHTTNDVVAWIPERRVLFAGDLVFNGGTPFALQGSIAGWLETLDRLESLGAETVIPGHGPVCGPEVYPTLRGYLRFVDEAARRGFEEGLAPLELARSLDLGEWERLSDPERIVGNLHRAYSELRGEPRGHVLDLMPVVADMQSYLGGPLVSHA